MKKYFILIFLLSFLWNYGQDDPKSKFQKTRYDLAVSYLNKSDFANALDLFSMASKIKPDNEIAKKSIEKIDELKELLRKELLEKTNGSWLKLGNKPDWTMEAKEAFKNKTTDELIEMNKTQILFYEKDRKTNTKKLIKTENIVFYNKDKSDALFSAFILSDGAIWNCIVNENSDMLHFINIAHKSGDVVEKITENNQEWFFVRMK
jgi:hypothetical protein